MLERLLDRLPHRKIFGIMGIYLTRWRLFSLGKRLVRVYLHKFHRSDEDREVHSHPWKWAVAIILKGGYVETRLERGELGDIWVEYHLVRMPGDVVVLDRDVFHRVELLGPSSWSLFIAGPEIDTWYFMHPITKRQTYWKDFIRRKGLIPED